jgi:isopenicillin N synthase-like dioxygenase
MSLPVIALDAPDAAEQIGDACTRVGFFQVVRHGVPEQVIDTAWRRTREFFDLPLDDRMAAARRHPDDAYGYLPMAFEALNRSLGGDDPAPPDLKQTFNIGPFGPPRHPLDDEGAAWAFAPSPWPPALPELRPALAAYYDEMDRLAGRLMRCFARALALPERFFDAFIDDAPGALRALDYPDLHEHAAPQPGQLRAGAHTDYGTLTILRQDDAPGGLEVLDPSTERWTPVPADPAAFVVNLGDLMQQWTNDRWRSTLHRVVVPPAGSGPARRQSMAFFHNANYHARIECLPTCLGPGEHPHHEPVIAGPHLQSKFRRAVGREY